MNIGRLFSSTRRMMLMTLLVVTASITLAACGGESTTATPTNTPGQGSTGTAQEMQVGLIEWGIEPKDIEVNAGKVSFVVSNKGQFPHDFSIEMPSGEQKTPVFQGSEGTKTLEVDLAPGTYKTYCSVGDHEERGMVGTLVVK